MSVVHSLIVLFAPFTLLIAVVVAMLDGSAGENDKSVATAFSVDSRRSFRFSASVCRSCCNPAKRPSTSEWPCWSPWRRSRCWGGAWLRWCAWDAGCEPAPSETTASSTQALG